MFDKFFFLIGERATRIYTSYLVFQVWLRGQNLEFKAISRKMTMLVELALTSGETNSNSNN